MRSLETIVWDHRRSQSVSSISFFLSHFKHLASKEQNVRDRKRSVCLKKTDVGIVLLLCPAWPRLFSCGWKECGSLSWSEPGKVADSTMLFLLPVDQERKPGWRVRLRYRSRRERGSLCSPLGKVSFIVTFNSFPVSKQRSPGDGARRWVDSYRVPWGMAG